MAGFTITIAGDSALNLEFAHAISAETSAKIRMAADNLTADPIRGITELVPTFCSLMVYYNPLVITFDELSTCIRCHGCAWPFPLQSGPSVIFALPALAL